MSQADLVRRVSFAISLGAFVGVSVSSAQGAVISAKDAGFGPSNPFYAKSTLPFEAPPFDKIKDSDYEPAIVAGVAEEWQEIAAIGDNAAAPTFKNTIVAMEKTGQLFQRAMAAFDGVTGANTDPELEKIQK